MRLHRRLVHDDRLGNLVRKRLAPRRMGHETKFKTYGQSHEPLCTELLTAVPDGGRR